jgi:hypothetical protein
MLEHEEAAKICCDVERFHACARIPCILSMTRYGSLSAVASSCHIHRLDTSDKEDDIARGWCNSWTKSLGDEKMIKKSFG